MIRVLGILLIIVFPIMVFSQTETIKKQKKFFFGINGGINISKFKSDSLVLTNGYKPYVGIYAKYKVINKLFLKTSISYSVKGSTSLKPYIKIKNEYLDINFIPQYQIFDDFYIQAGVSYSNILSSQYITRNGENKNGLQYQNIYDYNSELNLLAGLEFRLHDNMTFDFNFAIPLEENNIPSFQLGVNIVLFNRINNKSNYRTIRRKKSKQQIKDLKNSVLLVRLKTSENIIAAHMKVGDEKKAVKVKNKQKTVNQQIIKAFKENFDFCEVRFFYSNSSTDIKNNKFENVFLNDSLQIDNSIKIDSKKGFFIAEFEAIEQDTMKYYSHSSYEQAENGSYEDVDYYYSPSSDISFYALIIMDNNFVQLNRPFPFYLKVDHPIILKWTYKSTISEMNDNLNWYYYLHK